MEDQEQPFDPRAYWESRLADQSDVSTVGYAGLGLPFNAWMYRVRRTVFAHSAQPLVAEIDSALDIGSGSGFYIDAWHRLGVRNVTGSDIAEPAIERLRGRYPGTQFLRLDITAAPEQLPHLRFDAISAFDVTFHIVDDDAFARAFANMFTLLEPGGMLLFTDNFLEGPALRQAHHVSRTRAEIEATVARAGFEIVAHRPAFVLMNEPVDQPRRVHTRAWAELRRLLARHPRAGHLVGAALYPLELCAIRMLSVSPSTEIMVCRRPAD